MNATIPYLNDIFTALSLSSDAGKLYLTLLEHSGMPAGRLASVAGLKRSYTYNVLHELQERGLAHESEERGVKRFRAVDPTQLRNKLEAKLDSTQILMNQCTEILPLLKNFMRSSSAVPRIQVFKGADGVKAVYEDTLNCSEGIIRAVADFAAVFPEKRSDELNKWIWRYSSRRAARNIWYHGIVNRSKDTDLAFKRRITQKRKLKALEDIPLLIEINIYDDKVAICSTAEDMMGVIIQSAPIAKSAKLLHNVMWAQLRDYSLKPKQG